MDQGIHFPNLGIHLKEVGKTFEIFGFEVAYYGVVIVLGMLAGLLIMNIEGKRLKQNAEVYWDIGMVGVLFGVVGARIFYVIFAWETYQDDLLSIFNTRKGGLAIYGGIIGAAVAVFVFARIKKLSFLILLDCITPGLLIGQVIGRWGNFFNREVFGGYTNNLLAMQLPVSAVRQDEITQQMWDHIALIDGIEYIQVHPTFLYEGMWNMGAFLILWFYRKHKKFSGEIFMSYLVLYGVGRFWIEGVRTDQLLIPGTQIPISQVISVVGILVGAAYILKKRLSNKNKYKTQDVVES
jgi:phosphatidylglycerol:prolipoprotein diacylglycerol transferase